MKKALALLCVLTLLLCTAPNLVSFPVSAADKLTLVDGSLFTIDSEKGYLFIQTEKMTAAQITAEFTGTGVTLNRGETLLSGDSLAGTGDTVCLMSEHTTLDSLTVVILGDVNADGDVSVVDAIIVLRVAAKLDSFDSLVLKAAADVLSNDKTITVLDARKILRVAAGLESIVIKTPATKAEILRTYKSAVDKIVINGAAGYTKKEWEAVPEINFEDSVMSPVLEMLIDSNLVTEEAAVPVIYAKGSQEAKDNFPPCTLTDSGLLQSASCEYIDGVFRITMILQDEDNPVKGTSAIGQITDNVFYLEDIQAMFEDTQMEFTNVNTHIIYDDFTVTCDITPQGKFVSMKHFSTVNAQIDGTLKTGDTSMPVKGSAKIQQTDMFSKFKY